MNEFEMSKLHQIHPFPGHRRESRPVWSNVDHQGDELLHFGWGKLIQVHNVY